MKTKLFLLLCLLAFSAPVCALHFESAAPLYDHLCEVNAEWRKQVPGASLLAPVHFPSDRERIQKHLELIENELRTRDVSLLTYTQEANRLRHLDVLRDYRQTGVFPTNHYHTKRQPYFRDNFGVLCAVGYLMWHDGQQEAVNKINRENNYGYIAELASQYPELGVWALENGFTLDELAWIQPMYEPILPPLSKWGNGGGLNPGGRINVMLKDDAETRLFVAGAFSEIDGFAANNIAVWDGNGWSTLGDGVDGEVHALQYSKAGVKEKLYVAGNFTLPGQPDKSNIAEYNFVSKSWTGLQTGDMEGSIYTLHKSGSIYIGGDFKKVNGEDSPYLAVYREYDQSWNPYSWTIATDGPVRDFEPFENILLVGGDFKKVYQTTPGVWEDAPHVAYLSYYGNWLTFPHDLPPVHDVAFYNGNLFTGHKITYSGNGVDPLSGINILKGGLWFNHYYYPYADSLIHGFHEMYDRIIAYGAFRFAGINYGHGAVCFNGDDTNPVGYLLADSTVRGVIDFQDHVYLAGDFQNLWDKPYPGLARIALPTSTTTETAMGAIRVIASTGRLAVRYESLEEPASLRVYDLSGRLLVEETLAAGADEMTIDAGADWANGLYVWQLGNNSGARSGKWAVLH